MVLAESFPSSSAGRSTSWLHSKQGTEIPQDKQLDVRSLRALIVVPTLNEATHIGRVLRDLSSDAATLKNAVIAVVDGGSDDETCAIVRHFAAHHPNMVLLHNPARIQSAAVNLAARQLGQNAQVLIRCDAHALYPSRFCERLLSTMLRVGADSVVVQMRSRGNSLVQRAVAWVSNSIVGTGGSAHRWSGRSSGFVDHGHHAAFRMEMFRRAGGYDESFTHNEDAEFDCRQRALGAKIYLDTTVGLEYIPRASPAALWSQYFKYGAGRSRTARRHPHSARLRQAAVVVNLLMILMAFLLVPLTPLPLLWPALYFSVLAGTSVQIAVRERSLAGLLSGPVAAIMHTAWALGFLTEILTRREARWQAESAVPLWSRPALVERG
jgi:succinoglycan biosynthesis protein ExoA